MMSLIDDVRKITAQETEIDDLRAQLQKARGEIGRLRRILADRIAERDAAIERGRQVWEEYLAQVGFGRVLAAVRLSQAKAAGDRVAKAEHLLGLEVLACEAAEVLAEERGRLLRIFVDKWPAGRVPTEAKRQASIALAEAQEGK